MPMKSRISLTLSVAILSVLLANSAEAAKHKRAPKAPITEGITDTVISFKFNKKTKKSKISCYQQVAGKARKVKGGFSFTPFKVLMGRDPQNRSLYKALMKNGNAACANGGVLPGDYLSMRAYTGPFGEEQAHTLFNRFAWGASPEDIQQAVKVGLAATITRLTTYIPEPELDKEEANMQCNKVFRGDSRIGTGEFTCNPQNPNDIKMDGMRGALLYRHVATQNPFFDRLEFFLRDRFQSVNPRVVDDSQRRWSVLPYIALVRKAARSGDFVQYLRDFGKDYLAAMVWLHLRDSSATKPNEDEGREILQLGSVGPFNTDGSPVYGDLDVAQASLALTGWGETNDTNQFGFVRKVPSFSEARHAVGPERIFIGTKYEAQIKDLDSLVDAIVQHPRLAEYICEQIYDDFINPFATPQAIKDCAAMVRDNKYDMIKVMRVIMGSQALYAPKSHNSIVKQPLEYMIGFLKAVKVPLVNLDWYDDILAKANNLGQADLNPNTVFGWRNRDSLASQAYILSRRQDLTAWNSFLTQDLDDLYKKANKFTFWDRFLKDLPQSTQPSLQYVKSIESLLGVTLNKKQEDNLTDYLDYDYTFCDPDPQQRYWRCKIEEVNGYHADKHLFDPSFDDVDEGQYAGIYDPDSLNSDGNHYPQPQSYKTRGVISAIAATSAYQMK